MTLENQLQHRPEKAIPRERLSLEGWWASTEGSSFSLGFHSNELFAQDQTLPISY